MNLKRIFFTIVVLIIVLAFSASFFSAGIRSLINNDEEESTSEQQPSGIDEQSDELSPFIQSIKSSMVQSPETSENANSIAKAINVYNSLTEQDSDKILSFDGSNADFNSLKIFFRNKFL